MNDDIKIGDVVKMNDELSSNSECSGQFGVVIFKHDYNNDANFDYSILVWQNFKSGGRFWCVGFKRDEFEPQGYTISNLIEHLQKWMNTQYCLKTGIKFKQNKFGKHYNYWKKRKELGEEKAKR